MKQNREPFVTERDREESRSTVTLFVPRSQRSITASQAGVNRGKPIDNDDGDDDPGPSAA